MSVLDNAADFFTDLGHSWRAFRELRSARIDREPIPTVVPELKEDRRQPDTRLKVHTESDTDWAYNQMFFAIQNVAKNTADIPRRGTREYIDWIDNLWKSEPILSGAVYSMVAKMQSLTWRVEGGKYNCNRTAQMLSRARHLSGSDWSGFIGSSAIDFYVQDGGVWWDVTREDGSDWGMMTDLATIDTRCCLLTGNPKKPMYYYSAVVNQEIWYKPGMFIHFSSMPLPNEQEFGYGLCAVSRAARAAKLLMALHNYDEEKLSNLPPEGIASVTGLTEAEFRKAIAMWKAEREKNNSLTFPQVLWLVGSNPSNKISVDIASFSTIPESYDRSVVVDQYVNTLALDFGVDAREFWAISTAALGTASEAEVQHLKARGKGGGEFITLVERHLNAELPDNVKFTFDTQDIEEDMIAATVAKAWIDAYMPLAFPKQQGGGGFGQEGAAPAQPQEGAIDVKTFKRLLADKGVLPEWAVGDERVAIQSGEIHKEYLEDLIAFTYRAGRLSEAKLLRVGLQLDTPEPIAQLPATIKEEELPPPNIRGQPIPDDEVERGARVTAKAIRNEFEFWKTIPELEAHA